jgi:hypothetical protein
VGSGSRTPSPPQEAARRHPLSAPPRFLPMVAGVALIVMIFCGNSFGASSYTKYCTASEATGSTLTCNITIPVSAAQITIVAQLVSDTTSTDLVVSFVGFLTPDGSTIVGYSRPVTSVPPCIDNSYDVRVTSGDVWGCISLNPSGFTGAQFTAKNNSGSTKTVNVYVAISDPSGDLQSATLKTHEQGTATVAGTVTANAGTGTFSTHEQGTATVAGAVTANQGTSPWVTSGGGGGSSCGADSSSPCTVDIAGGGTASRALGWIAGLLAFGAVAAIFRATFGRNL